MIQMLLRLVLPLLWAVCVAGGESAWQFSDLNGAKVTPLAAEGKKGTVLIFISRDCPISNSFVPEMNRLWADYGGQFGLYLVQADPDISAAEAKKHAEAYDIKAPVLLDPQQRLARRTRARVTPESIVLSPLGEVVYQGRINDLYAALTKKRSEPTTRDLRDALDAILAGKAVEHPLTKAIGCSITLKEEIK